MITLQQVFLLHLLNLRDDLKIEMEDQQSISRSMRNYKKELMEATMMVIKHYNAENNYIIPEEDRTIEVNTIMVKCDNDHPVVYYSLKETGFAICEYCDMKYVYSV